MTSVRELLRRFVEAARRAQIVTIVNRAHSEAELGELVTAELCEAFEAEIAFVLVERDGGTRRALVGAYGLALDQRRRSSTSAAHGSSCVNEASSTMGDPLAIGPGSSSSCRSSQELDRGVVGVARLYDESFDEAEVALLEAVVESIEHALERLRLGEERDCPVSRGGGARHRPRE